MSKAKNELTYDNIFETLDFFMVRVPLLPVELYKRILAEPSCDYVYAQLNQILKQPIIREALNIASPSLMKSINQRQEAMHPKKAKKLVKTLAHYLIRLTTRATPYGIFAGVSIGTFADRSNLKVADIHFNKKTARPDMRWLMDLVKEIEAADSAIEQLVFRANPVLYMSGSRVKLPYLVDQSSPSKRDTIQSSSIRATKFVKLVLDVAQKPVPFKMLIRKLEEQFPDVDRKTCSDFIKNLLHQQFLISNLRPPLSIIHDEMPFRYIQKQLNTMAGFQDLKQSLQSVDEKMKQYNLTSIGNGENLYNQIGSEMNRIVPTENPIQVDMETSLHDATLSYQIKDEIRKAADTLWKVSRELSNPHLEAYRSAFIEQYGLQRQVPLLELLDEDMGLGAPPDYKYPLSKYEWNASPDSSQRETVLARWVAEAIRTGETVIELTDEKLREIEQPQSKLTPPPSLEMYVTVIQSAAENAQHHNYKLIVNPNSGSTGAGKTFGRFAPMLDTQAQEHIHNIYRQQADSRPNVIFAELTYLTYNSRHSNVVISNRACTHQIVLGTNDYINDCASTIPLSDLYVGCTHHSLYLKSRSLNKQVIPVTTNMLNYYRAPNVYRFLREIAQEEQRNASLFQWGNLSEFPMLPGITYRNTVLSPAVWSISAGTEAFKGCCHEQDWLQAFKTWKEQWKVPRYIYITIADNRLLLDTEHPFCQTELYDKYVNLSG